MNAVLIRLIIVYVVLHVILFLWNGIDTLTAIGHGMALKMTVCLRLLI